MTTPPKCKQCGVAHWGLEHVAKDRTVKPSVLTPSVAEVQRQKEQTFTALAVDVSRETFDWAKREKELGLGRS